MMRRTISAAVLAAAMGITGTFSATPVWADGNSGPYLAGRQAGMAGDYSEAVLYFSRALIKDPSNLTLMESAAHTQLALGNVDLAVPMAQRLNDAQANSQIAQLVLVADQAHRGDFDALLAQITQENAPSLFIGDLIKAWALMGKGEVDKALEAFDYAAEQRGMRGFGLEHKAFALAMVGDLEGAEAILAEHFGTTIPAARRGVIARAQILSQLDRTADAMDLLDESFGSDLDPFLQAMRDELALGQALPLTAMRSTQDGLAEVFYAIATALRNETDEEYTLLFSRVAEHLRADHTEAVLLSAQLLEALGQYDLSVETYKKITQDNPSFHAAELGRADALRRSGRTDAANEVLEQLTRTHGHMPIVFTTLGDLKRQLEQYDAAVAAYDAALEIYGAPEADQWFIYYARAISKERLGTWDAAEADFRQALALNPDQPQVLNYLGYSLVEQQIKLDEALGMIERAVAERPNSGYIVDSLGWVLYRLGRYEEAVPHMERAAELMPVDPVVNDHLGDVLWAVGRTREAEFQWKRALSFVDQVDASGDIDPDRIRLKLDLGLNDVLIQEGAEPLKITE